jgi:dipeptidyl aminopeptidase/acylaminoacyl peptidase
LIGIGLVFGLAGAPSAHDGPGMSSADTIALTTFNDPTPWDSHAQASPDGRHVVIVTTRGILASNQIESTLWIYKSEALERYLRVGAATEPPTPRVLVRVTGVPQAEQDRSNGSLITSVQWASDSRSVLYLRENQTGDRVPSRATVGGQIEDLGDSYGDVIALSSSADTTAFEFRLRLESRGSNLAAATLVDGRSIPEILLPNDPVIRDNDTPLHLAVVRAGKRWVVKGSGSPSGALVLAQFTNFKPSISPNGRQIAVVTPVREIPSLWEGYETTNPHDLPFKAGMPDSAMAAGKGIWPTQYSLVDLENESVQPLMEAPAALYGGYLDAEEISWSPSGRAVLAGNTYLPFREANGSEKAHRSHACAVAFVEISSGKSSCVVHSRNTAAAGDRWWVLHAQFGANDDEVIVSLRGDTQDASERYRFQNGHWDLERAARSSLSAQRVRVTVKQDLNTPPALWVGDPRSGRAKKLWDPNSELLTKDIGQVSLYRWKDASGHEWTGGLMRPVDFHTGTRYPLVVQTHGFQEHEFITDGAFSTAFAARALAAAGFWVLDVPDRMDHAETKEEALDNVRGYYAAVNALANIGAVDTARVGIIGFSRTCYYVENALIEEPSRFGAAVIADGTDISYVQYLLFAQWGNGHEGQSIYGTPPFGDGLANWVAKAPGFSLYRIKTPLLIQAIAPHGLLEEAEIYESLLLQGRPVDMLYIPSGQHILQKPLERLASQQASVDWMRFWLQGYQDPDPAKAEQYQRWRALRKLRDASLMRENAFLKY